MEEKTRDKWPYHMADNYALYLVTGRELLPPGKDYYESLDESLRGGDVSIVQVRCVVADQRETHRHGRISRYREADAGGVRQVWRANDDQ